MTLHNIDTLLQDLSSPLAERQRRAWFACYALVDWGVAPELAGKLAECYHFGRGVAPDSREALRLICSYLAYQKLHPHLDPRYEVPDDVVKAITFHGQQRIYWSRFLNVAEFINDSFSWVSGVPDLIQASYASEILIELCSKLGFISMGIYAFQFLINSISLIRDMVEQRHRYKAYGFWNVLRDNLIKDDRWRRLLDSTVWLVLPVLIFVAIPSVGMPLFLLGSAINLATVLYDGIKTQVDMVHQIRIIQYQLSLDQQALERLKQGESQTEQVQHEIAQLEHRIQSAEQSLAEFKAKWPLYLLDNLFCSLMMVVYIGGAIALYFNPLVGCAIMLTAMVIDFIHNCCLTAREVKAKRFHVPADLKQKFTFWGKPKVQPAAYQRLDEEHEAGGDLVPAY